MIVQKLTLLEALNPQDCIQQIKSPTFYKGKATFRCRGQYLQDLYLKFGAPSEPVKKDARCKTTYTVSEAEITDKFLYQFSSMYGNNIRIIGPKEAKTAINEHYKSISETILNPVIKSKKKAD